MPDPDADRLAKVLIAFANSDGGTIVIGVNPDGAINDSLMFDDVEDVLRMALVRCRPGMRTEWQRSEVAGGEIAAIRVPPQHRVALAGRRARTRPLWRPRLGR